MENFSVLDVEPIIRNILAPLIGGFISEDYSWCWASMLSVPPAMLRIFSFLIFMRIPELKAG